VKNNRVPVKLLKNPSSSKKSEVNIDDESLSR